MGFTSVGGAEPLLDPNVGLSVDPPPGYTAEAVKRTGRYKAAFSIKKLDDQTTGCKAAFQPNPQNGNLSQAEINAAMATSEWREAARNSLGLLYSVSDMEPFKHDGVSGVAITAGLNPLMRALAPDPDVQNFLILLETPRGRTTLVCVAEARSFEARRPEFEAVARGLTLPR